jgi:hypothetical protein
MHLENKVLKHLFSDLKISDDTVFERANRRNIAEVFAPAYASLRYPLPQSTFDRCARESQQQKVHLE